MHQADLGDMTPHTDDVGTGQASTESERNEKEPRFVSIPRFRGSKIAALDRNIIMVLPPILIVTVVIAVTLNPNGSAEVIDSIRTFVTAHFTWLFIAYSLVAVVLCAWAAFSKVGSVRLGGPQARPEHGKFAWYSMLFACGQGIGLIFWSVAEPILLSEGSPVISPGDFVAEGGLVWTYFHWGLTAWAMYCLVALCLAYSHHNLGKSLTFREAVVDILPIKTRRTAGVIVELLAIIATVLGLATSFGFAALQFTSGLSSFTGLPGGPVLWLIVIAALGGLTMVSAFLGVNKGMKRVSETNSILSIVLMIGVLVFGPTLFILSTMTQSFGSFIGNLVPMSFWTEAQITSTPLSSWEDAWNGSWTVFIWCWVIAFSPFVGGFIARISRGRSIREFVLGVTIVPSLIVMVWVAILGGSAIYYDGQAGGSISSDVARDTSTGLFSMLEMVPVVGKILLVVATILVATYYVTSLDSGTHALAEFVNAPMKSGPWFRVVLVLSIGTVAVVLLTVGGSSVVDTVQTGTIIGAFPFTFVLLLMFANLVRRLRSRNARTKQEEKTINENRRLPEDDHVDKHGIPIRKTGDSADADHQERDTPDHSDK